MQNLVTPSESCRSAMCLRVRGVHDHGLSNDVNASLPTHALPYTCATEAAPFRSAT